MARRKADSSDSLFPSRTPLSQPLADRMRPRTLDELVGQEHLLGPGKFLSQMVAAHVLHSMILWGPPGTGKTTLAMVLAEHSGAVFRKLAAVTSGVADLREAVEAARRDLDAGKPTVVFIDEIHRWNRAQQDAFLPHVRPGVSPPFLGCGHTCTSLAVGAWVRICLHVAVGSSVGQIVPIL